jgi:(p)ppGpp synthase/HD superfamily hydrolase
MPEPTILSPRFQEALVFAAELHANQRRKLSGTPYLGHLLRVTGIVLDYGAGEDEAVAALLHDAVEDQGGAAAREEIRRRFGDAVVRIVDGCSDTDQSPKPPWRVRKEAYLAHLETAGPSVRLVSAADKLDNVRSLTASYRKEGEAIWRHFGGGREGTIWYYRNVIERLKMHEPCPLVDELERAVADLEGVLA